MGRGLFALYPVRLPLIFPVHSRGRQLAAGVSSFLAHLKPRVSGISLPERLDLRSTIGILPSQGSPDNLHARTCSLFPPMRRGIHYMLPINILTTLQRTLKRAARPFFPRLSRSRGCSYPFGHRSNFARQMGFEPEARHTEVWTPSVNAMPDLKNRGNVFGLTEFLTTFPCALIIRH